VKTATVDYWNAFECMTWRSSVPNLNEIKLGDTIKFRMGFKYFENVAATEPTAWSISRFDYTYTLLE
jgi:hypothetical protein